MSLLSSSSIVMPTFLLIAACSSEEHHGVQHELLPVDAGVESNDNPRGDSGVVPDAVRSNSPHTAPSHTTHADTQAPNDNVTSGSSQGANSTQPVNATQTGVTSATPSTADSAQSSESPTSGLETDPDALQLHPCGPGQCGTLQVPIDYDDPLGPTLGLGVFVGPATAERRGVLYFNPGGPGLPVATPETYPSLYAALNELMPSMDIVLIDNRGVGASEGIDCIPDDELWAQAASREVNTDLDFFEMYGDYWRGLNDACISKFGEAKLSSFSTANVARDMERVRVALGDETINLWMVSYGTAQASAYAALFPDRVGAFVLDSPVYVGQTTVVDDILASAKAYEHELTRFLNWCALEGACNLGDTISEVKDAYEVLRNKLDEGVVVDGLNLSALVLDSYAESALMRGEWDLLANTLRELVNENWAVLLQGGEESDPEASWRFTQANAVYRLLDFGCPADFSAETALELADGVLETSPHFALKSAVLLSQCVGWHTRASRQRVITKELPSVPLLIVTSAHDAATPLSEARSLQSEFNNGSLLYISQKEGHGVLRSDATATVEVSEFIETGDMNAACQRLSCLEAGAPDPTLNALRVLTKPTPGKQRLPRLPELPGLLTRR